MSATAEAPTEAPAVVGAYRWIAVMADGTPVWQDDARSLNAADKTKVRSMILAAADDPDDARRHHVVDIPAGAEPFAFWRTPLIVSPSVALDGDGNPHVSLSQTTGAAVVCIGWRKGKDKRGVFVWGHPDGSVVVTDRDPYDIR